MQAETQRSGRPASYSREQAIDRAINLFWRDGYHGITVRDLASAMQIQRSSFYNTFGNKESVFIEALKTYSQLAPDAVLDQISDQQAVIPVVVQMLRQLCRTRIADKQARGCLICNSVAELVGVDRELGPVLDEMVNQRVAVMESLFNRAIDHNEFTPRSPAADIARSFVTLLFGINLASKSLRTESELWGICATFLRGIGVSESHLK